MNGIKRTWQWSRDVESNIASSADRRVAAPLGENQDADGNEVSARVRLCRVAGARRRT